MVKYQQHKPNESRTNSLSIISFIVGIVGFIFSFVPYLGLIPGIASLVCGIIALNQINNNHLSKGKIYAIIGIISGSIAIMMGLVWILVAIYGV
jgi:hypothetical protein